jgi:hypothetical protein
MPTMRIEPDFDGRRSMLVYDMRSGLRAQRSTDGLQHLSGRNGVGQRRTVPAVSVGSDYAIGRSIGVRDLPRRPRGQCDANQLYRVCGGLLFARWSEVPIVFGGADQYHQRIARVPTMQLRLPSQRKPNDL